MSMSKHTPGPWRAVMHNLGLDERWFIQFDGPIVRDTTIAAMNGYCVAYTNAEADARLIAAAPELLKALEVAEMVLILLKTEVEGLKFNSKNVLPRVQAAIRKAKGGN